MRISAGCLLAVVLSGHAIGAFASTALIDTSNIRGGLIVHVGPGTAEHVVQPAQLRPNGAYLVHGLYRNPMHVAAVRDELQARGLYGPISVDVWRGAALPYCDNLVNLIIVEEGSSLAESEILRVLVPRGVALVRRNGCWDKTVKPWPAEIDQWTHFLHGPDNNAVAADRVVGVPRHLQWVGDPKYARSHEHLASVSAMVTAEGRLFYIVDEGLTADIRLPARWRLVARDAFNGVVLWKRDLGPWMDHLYGFRSGPAPLPFRLVAGGQHVYVTLGINDPVTALDAATGETVLTFPGTEHTDQIVHSGDMLVMFSRTGAQSSRLGTGSSEPLVNRLIVATADSGQLRWQREIEANALLPLVASDGTLAYQTAGQLVCLDLASGRERWRVDHPMALGGAPARLPAWAIPTLTACRQIIYVADFRTLSAYRLADGQLLWEASSAPGFNSPPDVFVIGDQVWRGYQRGRGTADFGEALNATTGAVDKTLVTKKAWEYPTLAHYRCYRPKATSRFILSSRSGIELIDVESGEIHLNHWVRGTCQYGVLPVNGLLYAPPHSCACNIKTMVRGLTALAPASRDPSPLPEPGTRWEPGPAFAKIAETGAERTMDDDWPTYRHDAERSGRTASRLPDKLHPVWTSQVGGRLSSPVASGGRVLVAVPDAHAVVALDVATGERQWRFVAGGRVDSPPTVHGRKVLFGSADGWVYCLRAGDGALAWRFRAAPAERRIVVRGELESPWPVPGSVLVQGDSLVVAAGRSSYLDGGIFVYRLEPGTGEVLAETVIDSLDPMTGEQPEGGVDLRGVLNDVLAASGESVFMRHLQLDFATGDDLRIGPPHLFAPMGFLDDAWWHRAYWLFGTDPVCMPPTNESGWNIWPRVGNMVPAGRILALGEDLVYGYGRDRYPGGPAGQVRGGEQYHLFAMARTAAEPLPSDKRDQHLRYFRSGVERGLPVTERDKRYGEPKLHRTLWSRPVEIYARALVLAGTQLALAGPREPAVMRTANLRLDDTREAEAALAGQRPARLLVVDSHDGTTMADCDLPATPVFDGLIAARGRIFLSLENGTLVCLGTR